MPLTDAERLAGLQKHQDCREEAHCWEKTVRAPKRSAMAANTLSTPSSAPASASQARSAPL